MTGRPPSSPATKFTVADVAVLDEYETVGTDGKTAGIMASAPNPLIGVGVERVVEVLSPTCPVPFPPQQKRP